MQDKNVCFSGHRLHKLSNADDIHKIKIALASELLHCVKEGYNTFLSGMADGFDMLAAEEVLKLKADFAHIRLIAVIPCHNWRDFSGHEKTILNYAHEVIAVAESAGTKNYHKRNRYLVDNASLLICYYNSNPGGTKYTVNYAKQNGLEVINIFDIM